MKDIGSSFVRRFVCAAVDVQKSANVHYTNWFKFYIKFGT